MAEFPTKRIINLGEQSAPQSGDYIVTDNQTNGTKKTPASALATSQALTAEATARQQADTALDGKITAEAQARAEAITAEQTAREQADEALTESVTALSDEVTAQGALIQNPTKTVSGSIAHFTDGAEMPAKSVIVNIEPQQSGTGTPSPDNVRQISGWESVNVTDAGKNLCPYPFVDTTKTINGMTFVDNGDGTLTLNGTTTASAYFNVSNASHSFVLKAGTYTFMGSGNARISVTLCKVVNGVGVHFKSATISNITFTIDEDTDFYFYVAAATGATADNLLVKLQLEEGSTATDYVPYIGTTTSVNLGRTVYGGTLDVVSGSLTDKMAIVTFDGSEAWALDATVSGVTKFYITQSDMKKMNNYTSALIANNMTASRNGYTTDDVSYMSVTGYSGSVGNYIYIMSKGAETGITTVAQLKEWLASHNLQVVYPLEQPQTYQLTPQEVKTLLGENNVWADAGSVSITYRRDINLALEQLETLLNGTETASAQPTASTAETSEA